MMSKLGLGLLRQQPVRGCQSLPDRTITRQDVRQQWRSFWRVIILAIVAIVVLCLILLPKMLREGAKAQAEQVRAERRWMR